MQTSDHSPHYQSALPDIPRLRERVSAPWIDRVQAIIDGKTKPLGALGTLETLMQTFALCSVLRGEGERPLTANPRLLVFAGDHGIASKGVSIAGSDVTTAMVQNFLAGGAAVSVVARQAGIPLEVVDCGIATPVAKQPGLIDCRLGAGTAPFDEGPAMSLAQARDGLARGAALAARRAGAGMNVLCVGEMGIGNTSAAAALMAGLTGVDPRACVGRGTGIDATALMRKQALVERAVALHATADAGPMELAARLGGFELIVMAGALLGAAQAGVLVLVDGFVSSVAACLGCALVPALADYLIFTHLGAERGHAALLEYLGVKPLFGLDLRIGEGVGSALAYPVLNSALACYNEMASFSDAGISL